MMEDLIMKYRLDFDKMFINGIYQDLEKINRVVRYNEKLELVVDRYLEEIKKCKRIERDIEDGYKLLERGRNRLKMMRRSGVSYLEDNGNLVDYLKILSKGEREVLLMSDVGVSEVVGEIEREEWRNKSMSNGY
jgi:hypothetical protein